MKNIYGVSLVNSEGCQFDNDSFTNLKVARKWASGRGGRYTAYITKNHNEYTGVNEDELQINY